VNESNSNGNRETNGSQQKELAPSNNPEPAKAPSGNLPHHLQHLRESGLSDQTIRAAGLYSATNNVEKARRLWATILSKRLDNFSQRQLHQRLRRSFSLDEIIDALQTLEYLGYIRRIPSEAVGKVGRPASPVFQVNPLAHTQNTQNSGDDANYEDSVYAQQIPQEQKLNNKVDEEPDTACTQNTQNHQSGTKPEQEDEQVPDWF